MENRHWPASLLPGMGHLMPEGGLRPHTAQADDPPERPWARGLAQCTRVKPGTAPSGLCVHPQAHHCCCPGPCAYCHSQGVDSEIPASVGWSDVDKRTRLHPQPPRPYLSRRTGQRQQRCVFRGGSGGPDFGGGLTSGFFDCSAGTEQDHIPPPPPHTVSSACLLPVENFSQTVSLIRDVRNAETEENSQRRLNNNKVVIKHSQGPSVLSQGLERIF